MDTEVYCNDNDNGEYGDILHEIEKELKVIGEYDEQCRDVKKYFQTMFDLIIL